MSDNNFFELESFTTHDNVVINEIPGAYDDLMKGSGTHACHVNNVTIGPGAREDAIDLNNECFSVFIKGGTINAGKKNGITIKGGCEHILIKDLVIVPNNAPVHIELGNYSDQSFKRTTDVVIDNVRTSDGSPLLIRVGHADKPQVTNCPNVKYLNGFWLKIYVVLKHYIPFIP